MKKVFICSPYKPQGYTENERRRNLKQNIKLAKKACRYALKKGCLPYAPHLYFTRFLSYEERETGVFLGTLWLAECDEIWVVGNRITEGMEREIDMAKELGIPMLRKEKI